MEPRGYAQTQLQIVRLTLDHTSDRHCTIVSASETMNSIISFGQLHRQNCKQSMCVDDTVHIVHTYVLYVRRPHSIVKASGVYSCTYQGVVVFTRTGNYYSQLQSQTIPNRSHTYTSTRMEQAGFSTYT